ncbi:MAG: hypothetical protein JWQ49_5116 [Edaphobacter sp.]|nr:hypothetical protein [Edaphobacter sp.]
MPLLMGFLVRYTNDLISFLFHILTAWTRSPCILVGRAIALLSVDEPTSGHRISTDTYSTL